jgi:RHS repeat-associated protein
MVDSVTDPGSRTTSFTYDSRGNRLTTIHPDDSITHNRYNSKNQREATWGSLAYATVYSYDYAWRRLTLGTSPTITNNVPVNNTGIITYWQYSPDTGVLTGKFHDYREQGHARGANLTDGPTYTHTAAGRLQSRTWKRGVTTGYYYNQAGQLRAVNYSDATPDVLYTHDRLGRVTTAAQGTLNTGTMGLDPTLRFTTSDYNATEFTLDSESTSLGGGFPDKTLTRHTDTTGRLRSLQIDTEYTAAYGYDSAGRLKDVWDRPTLTTAGEPTGDPTFTYGYLNNSNGLVQTVTGPAHTVTNTWETTRDVLASKVNAIAGNNIPSSFAYGVNAIGQRTTVSPVMVNNQPVSTYTPKWAWDYNDQGELIEANDQAGSNDRAFQYDDIGNREKTVNGLLGNLPSAPVNYTANPLNQYTATPLAVASPVFDADGNLTEDREANKDSEDRQYVWDAENRLIAVNSVTRNAQGDITATTGLVTYQYDYMSRLITRTTTAGTTRFLYDGWNLIAEYTGTTLTKTYTWGMDLSGTMQGAGGVGGLLAVNDGTASYYPTFDGNGNVSEYLAVAIVNNVPVVSIVAHYEYDAFGNTVVWSGAKVADFSHRFSTKSLDQVTGWYYYGYRYYDPLTGRWPSRDPIEEEGGINLYGFVENSSINYIDYLGELTWIKEDANWVRQWGNQLRAQNQEGGIQWSDPGVDVLAYTVPRVKGKFKCKKDAAAAATGCWKLSDTTLTYNSEVVLHTDRWYRKEKVDPAWVVRAKNDHVADFDKWASQTGKPLAERTEKEKLKKGYPSKSDCEDVAAETFRVALQKSALIAVQATIAAHDTSKKHSWGDPNQRP